MLEINVTFYNHTVREVLKPALDTALVINQLFSNPNLLLEWSLCFTIQRLNSANCISFLPTGALVGSAKMGHLANWTGGSVILFICCHVGAMRREGPREDITNSHLCGERIFVSFWQHHPSNDMFIQVVAIGSNCRLIQTLGFFHTPDPSCLRRHTIGATSSEFQLHEALPLGFGFSVYGAWPINSWEITTSQVAR